MFFITKVISQLIPARTYFTLTRNSIFVNVKPKETCRMELVNLNFNSDT